MPTESERRQFGERLRALCVQERWSAPKLAERLSNGVLPDYTVTDANIRRWWAGANTPRRRDVVVELENVLHAPGELLPLLGLAVELDGHIAELDSLRTEVGDLRNQIAELKATVERLDSHQGDSAARAEPLPGRPVPSSVPPSAH